MRLQRLTAPGRPVSILTPWLHRRQILPARVGRQSMLADTLGPGSGGQGFGLAARSPVPTAFLAPSAASPNLLPRAAGDAVPPVRRVLTPLPHAHQHSPAPP